MRSLVVTVPDMISSKDLAPLKALGEVRYVEKDHISEQDLAQLCQGFDYLMLNYDVVKELSPAFYEYSSVQGLQGISADITGMDWASPASAKQQGVALFNIPDYSSQSVAETVLAEILLHSRSRHLSYGDQIRGSHPEARKGINLSGRAAGVVGLGAIGQKVYHLLENLGMEVVAWNRSPRPGFHQVSRKELFSRSQVVAVCLKTVREGEEENAGIISGELLDLAQDCILVNLANGHLVDHRALVDALGRGKIRGYTVEASQAPKDPDLSVWPQVHLPPSDAWFSDESLNQLRRVWVENILRAAEGSPQNLVEG